VALSGRIDAGAPWTVPGSEWCGLGGQSVSGAGLASAEARAAWGWACPRSEGCDRRPAMVTWKRRLPGPGHAESARRRSRTMWAMMRPASAPCHRVAHAAQIAFSLFALVAQKDEGERAARSGVTMAWAMPAYPPLRPRCRKRRVRSAGVSIHPAQRGVQGVSSRKKLCRGARRAL